MSTRASLPIVLTRPAGRGEDLIDALRAEGYRLHVLPLLRLAPLPVPDLNSLPVPDKLVFVSPSAVEFSLPHLPESWMNAELLAVGRGTASQLPAAVQRRVRVPMPETSEGLLELDELKAVEGQTLIIVRGSGGRELLARSLRQRGADCRYLEVYQRLGPEMEHLQALRELLMRPVILVVTSGEALAKLCAIIGAAQLRKASLIVVSERLAEMAAPHCPHVINARGADTAALRLAIDRAIRQRQEK